MTDAAGCVKPSPAVSSVAMLLARAYLRLLSAREGDDPAIAAASKAFQPQKGSLSLDVLGHKSVHGLDATAPSGRG